MKATLSFLAIVAASGIAALATADEKKTVADDLPHYYAIRADLAADKTDAVAEHGTALAKSGAKAVAAAAESLAKAADLGAARKSFGDLSKAVIAEIDRASKAGAKLGPIYVFDCSMTKPYGRWVQETSDTGNPYQGSKMLTCGKLIASIGAPATDDAKKKEDCCGGGKKKGEGGHH